METCFTRTKFYPREQIAWDLCLTCITSAIYLLEDKFNAGRS